MVYKCVNVYRAQGIHYAGPKVLINYEVVTLIEIHQDAPHYGISGNWRGGALRDFFFLEHQEGYGEFTEGACYTYSIQRAAPLKIEDDKKPVLLRLTGCLQNEQHKGDYTSVIHTLLFTLLEDPYPTLEYTDNRHSLPKPPTYYWMGQTETYYHLYERIMKLRRPGDAPTENDSKWVLAGEYQLEFKRIESKPEERGQT